MNSIFRKFGSFFVLFFTLLSAYAADEAVFYQSSGGGQRLIPSGTVIVSAPLQITLSRLEGVSEAPVIIDLLPFTVAAPDAQLVIHGAGGSQTSALEIRQYFRGTTRNHPNSFAFLGLDSSQSAKAIIHADSTVVVADIATPNPAGARGMTARPVNSATDFADRTFQCGVDDSFLSNFLKNSTEAGPLNEIVNLAIRAGTHLKANLKADAPAPLRRANLIIETDFELFQALGGNTSTYVQDLMAYVSSIYQTEASTRFQIGQLNVYTTAADPWAQTSTSGMLGELLTYWNDPARSALDRHHVHLISGKSAGGGIAYLNTLANKSFAYGVSANIEGSFVPSNPQVVWDAVVVAHEIGHAFGSTHTHNYDAPFIGSSTGGAIDCCAVGDSDAATQCRAVPGRIGQLPGVGAINGGTPGARNGTIMSYCHLLTPGMSNIAMTFGMSHTFGVNAFRVADVLRTSAATSLPLEFDLTVAKSGTGTGTVTSSPAGISCGSDCSEAYAASTSVTLTAAAAVGSSFGGWSGSCSGTSATCNVTMSEARNVTATFTTIPSVEPLRITGLSGAASSSQNFAVNVPSGATNLVIQLSGGTPNADLYVKAGQAVTVGNADCASSQLNTNNETCSFLTPSATTYNILVFGTSSYSGATLTATYSYAGSVQTLNLTKAGTGSGTVTSSPAGISCGLDCKEAFATGTNITLTATPAAGSQLKSWTGCNVSTGNTCTVSSIGATTGVTATFDKSGGITPILMLLLD